jgi:hypothetical protein
MEALGCGGEPLDGLDPDDRGDHGDLETAVGFAEVFFDGLAVEPAGNLLGRRDGELATGDLNEASALKFVLEQFALDLCAFQDGVGMAERIGKRGVGKVVKARWGYDRDVGSLGHGLLRWLGLEPGRKVTLPLGLHLGYPSFMAKSNRDIPKKKRGPPSQGGRKPPQLVRMDDVLTSAIDHWRGKQSDELSRPEAIRRLVELGLKKGK